MLKKVILFAVLALSCAVVLGKTVLIDVRTTEEFSAGHLAGALNIDHQVIGQRIGMADVAKDDEVILYCHSGRRAGIALDTLNGLGYKHVANYGGMEEARKKLQRK